MANGKNQFPLIVRRGLVITEKQLTIFRLLSRGYCHKEIAVIEKRALRSIHQCITTCIKRNKLLSPHQVIFLLTKKI